MATEKKCPKIAVILPCFNEQEAIGTVVNTFSKSLPSCQVHVFDNASTDDTALEAKNNGAIVHRVDKKGKGHVVQAMFRDINADYYIMADGDGTYPAEMSGKLLDSLIQQNADMVVGNRLPTYVDSDSRKGHLVGNRIITKTVNYLFDSNIQDLLSGYRVMTRSFVKSIPLFSRGFEVETAISIHAIEIGAKVLEIPISYSSRAEGTSSKLNTASDGTRIGWEIFKLYKDHKPIVVYGSFALSFWFASILIGFPVILEYIESGLVPRFPSAILAVGLMVLSFLFGFTGIILSAISKSRKEIKKLAFIAVK